MARRKTQTTSQTNGPGRAGQSVIVAVLAIGVGGTVWALRFLLQRGCDAYFYSTARFASHPLEGGQGLWTEHSSTWYAAMCLGTGPWPITPVARLLGTGGRSGIGDPALPELVSSDPPVYVVDGFLRPEEAKEVLDLFRERELRLSESTMQATAEADYRTSSTAHFTVEDELDTPLLEMILRRIHLYARVPLMHGEVLQIARYRAPGGKYELHRDSDNGVQRIATAIVYLGDEQLQGGETVFPMVGPQDPSKPKAVEIDMSKIKEGIEFKRRKVSELCSEKAGTVVSPKVGRLVLFYNLGQPWKKPNGDINISLNAYHGSCPVQEGEKWILQRWLHTRPMPDQLKVRGKGAKRR